MGSSEHPPAPLPPYSFDLIISLQFFEDQRLISFNISSLSTVQHLMSVILASVKPPESWNARPIEIRDDSMFIFRGEDLRTKDASCTLRDLGMADQADVFIIHPGPLVKGSVGSKSSALFSLARDARKAARTGAPLRKFYETAQNPHDWMASDFQFLRRDAKEASKRGIPLNTFLETVKKSFNYKMVSVDVPVSEGLDLVISIKTKPTDQISYVRDTVQYTILQTYAYCDLEEARLRLGEFDLILVSACLDPGATLAQYPINEQSRLKLSRKSIVIHVMMPLPTNNRRFPRVLKIDPSDKIRKIKSRIHQLSGVPPDNLNLRYKNKWLADDSKSFVDYGLSFYFNEVFPWVPDLSGPEMLTFAWPHGLSSWGQLSDSLEVGDVIGKYPFHPLGIHEKRRLQNEDTLETPEESYPPPNITGVQSDLEVCSCNSEMCSCNSGTPCNSPTSSLEMGSLKSVCPYTESAGTTTLVHPYWEGWTGATDTQETTVDILTGNIIGVNKNCKKFYLHGHLLFLSAGNSTMCEAVMKVIEKYLDSNPATRGLDLLRHLLASKSAINELQSWAMQEHRFLRELFATINIIDKNSPFHYHRYGLFKRRSNAYLENFEKTLEKELKSSKNVPSANREFAEMCEFEDSKSSMIKAIKVMSESAKGDDQTGGHALVFQGGPSHNWVRICKTEIPLKEN